MQISLSDLAIRFSPLPFFVCGVDGLVRLWNPAAERFFGWAAAEVLGKPLPCIPEDRRDEHAAMRRRTLEGHGFRDVLVERIRKDGTRFRAAVSTANIMSPDGCVAGVAVIYRPLAEDERGLAPEDEDAAEQLAEMEQIYKSAPVGLCYMDAGLRYVRINEQLARINGAPVSEHIGKNLRDMVPGLADALEPVYRRVIQTGETILRRELRGAAPSRPGEVRDWLVSLHPVKKAGVVKGVATVVEDITDLKDAIEREQASRQEAETLNRLGRLLNAEMNLEKLVQAVTDAATELTGAQFGSFFYNVRDERGDPYMLYALSGLPANAAGRLPLSPDADLVAPALRSDEIVRIADVREDPRYGVDFPSFGAQGPGREVASYLAVPVVSRSGEVLGGLFFGHSEPGVFTERVERIVASLASQSAIAMDNARLLEASRKARQELAEVNERLSNILESVADAFVAMDREWRITHVNSKACVICGKTVEEMLGHNAWELFPQTVGSKLYKELRRASETRASAHFETYYPPVGMWLEIDTFPTRFGMGLFARDITARKQFEEQIRQTQKLESLGVLAGGVAHDFNNLLVGILGNTSLALDTLPPEHPARKKIGDAMEAANQAAHLTRQLLAYAGKGRFIIEPLDLSRLVGGIAALIRTSIPRNVRLRLNLGAGLPAVEGDAVQLQQLVMNLVINGAEAIGADCEGSVHVTTALREVSRQDIEQAVAAGEISPGAYVVLEVRDTGSGMDEATLSKIFDPFFTTKFTGRGLGLAAVLGIVRGHKGALKVSSSPGYGSTFQVLLPASAAPPRRRERNKPSGRGLAGAGTVLVVDDEEIVRRTAQSTLEAFGYKVIAAENGLDAVELFDRRREEISAVLLDMTMPVMGGEEALGHLQQIDAKVKVILSSGFNEVEAVQRFAGKGLAGFLQKPYSAEDLARKVKEVMAGG